MILGRPKSQGPPYGEKSEKNVGLLIYITQKKGFDALNATQKNSALCKVTFLDKSRKNSQK